MGVSQSTRKSSGLSRRSVSATMKPSTKVDSPPSASEARQCRSWIEGEGEGVLIITIEVIKA